MPLCKLCQLSEATQTGSHLLSAFVVESMIGPRGREKGYTISAAPNFDYLRNVGSSSVVADFILCRGCEQRLAYLESYVSQEFIQKIDKPAQEVNFSIVKEDVWYFIKSCDKLNSAAFFLLIASLLWRISLAKTEVFNNFQLTPVQEGILRTKLNALLPAYANFKVKPNRKQWLEYVKNNVSLTPSFNFSIITSSNKADTSANMVLAPHFISYPYSLMLNEFLLLAYFPTANLANIQEDYFALGNIITDPDTINVPGPDEKIKITYIPQQTWQHKLNRIRQILKDQKLEALREHFAFLHYSQYGTIPSEETVNRMILSARSRLPGI